MTAKRMTCIVCPNGCELDVEVEGRPTGASIHVKGNLCPKGERYALEELTDPHRTLTTTVRVRGGDQPQTSVRTAAPIPRDALRGARDALRTIVVDAPIALGAVVASDVAGTGIDVIVTRAVD